MSLNIRELVPKRCRNLVRRALTFLTDASDELLRTFLMLFVLQPSADLLSRGNALRVARWCASVMLRMPRSGPPARKTMKRCYGLQNSEALEDAQEYLAQPFYAFAIFRRILQGREQPNEWKVEETNSQEVVQLRESGQSFIVATGHFRREFLCVLGRPQITPGNSVLLSVPLPAPSLSPRVIRTRVHHGQILRTIRHIHPKRMEIVYLDTGNSAPIPASMKLLNHLRQSGNQVIVAVDAFWSVEKTDAHTRPFAGMRARTFGTGSVALGRLAQCPVVACAAYVRNDGTVVLEWGPMIPPPPRKEQAADIRNTDKLLDFMEVAIGRRPTQYVLYIGEERRWNSLKSQWEDYS